VADDASFSTSSGLHHHGEEQDRAGYSLAELLHLCQSTVPAQRAMSLNTLAALLSRALLPDSQESRALSTELAAATSQLVPALRISLDSSNVTIAQAALACFEALLVNQREERHLVVLAALHGGEVVMAAQPEREPRGGTDTDRRERSHAHEQHDGQHEQPDGQHEQPDGDDPEADHVGSPAHDGEAARRDLIGALLRRMGLAARLQHLLRALVPTAPHLALPVARILARCARHSRRAAELLAAQAGLVDALLAVLCVLQPTADSAALLAALDFCTLLCAASSAAAAHLLPTGQPLPALRELIQRCALQAAEVKRTAPDQPAASATVYGAGASCAQQASLAGSAVRLAGRLWLRCVTVAGGQEAEAGDWLPALLTTICASSSARVAETARPLRDQPVAAAALAASFQVAQWMLASDMACASPVTDALPSLALRCVEGACADEADSSALTPLLDSYWELVALGAALSFLSVRTQWRRARPGSDDDDVGSGARADHLHRVYALLSSTDQTLMSGLRALQLELSSAPTSSWRAEHPDMLPRVEVDTLSPGECGAHLALARVHARLGALSMIHAQGCTPTWALTVSLETQLRCFVSCCRAHQPTLLVRPYSLLADLPLAYLTRLERAETLMCVRLLHRAASVAKAQDETKSWSCSDVLYAAAFELLGEVMPGEEAQANFLLKRVLFGPPAEALLRSPDGATSLKAIEPHRKSCLHATELHQLYDCYTVLFSCATSTLEKQHGKQPIFDPLFRNPGLHLSTYVGALRMPETGLCTSSPLGRMWPYLPFLLYTDSSNAVLGPNLPSEFASLLLRFYLWLEDSQFALPWLPAAYKFIQVMKFFLLPDLFLSPEVSCHLDALQRRYTADPKQPFDFSCLPTDLFSFFDACVDEFVASSYGDAVFGRYISLFLQTTLPSTFQRRVWSDPLACVRQLAVVPVDEQTLHLYVRPGCTNVDLLNLYAEALIAWPVGAHAHQQSLVYRIAVEHLAIYLATARDHSFDALQLLKSVALRGSSEILHDVWDRARILTRSGEIEVLLELLKQQETEVYDTVRKRLKID